LEQGGAKGTNSNEDKRGGPNYKPSSNPYERGLVRTLAISVEAALLGLAMKLGYEAFEAPQFVVPALVVGVIAVTAITHGLWYAYTGVWGLPGLYIL
jgi:hypothetical protein